MLFCSLLFQKRGFIYFLRLKKTKKLWMIAIKRDKWVPGKYSVVCAAHFTENDYYGIGLKITYYSVNLHIFLNV